MAIAAYEHLSDSSRVWIYRSDRRLTIDEENKVNNWLSQFVQQWTAHNNSLSANAKVYHHQFIVILLDEENSAEASGCSIDSQVRFIKDMGNALKVDFFDRLYFDFLEGDQVVSYHKDEVKNKIESGELSSDPLVFDHVVKTKHKFVENWAVPLSQSWHSRLI